jgi:hypothetical protein
MTLGQCGVNVRLAHVVSMRRGGGSMTFRLKPLCGSTFSVVTLPSANDDIGPSPSTPRPSFRPSPFPVPSSAERSPRVDEQAHCGVAQPPSPPSTPLPHPSLFPIIEGKMLPLTSHPRWEAHCTSSLTFASCPSHLCFVASQELAEQQKWAGKPEY